MEYTCSCADMQSYVNVRCGLITFQALSTNFGDNPRILGSMYVFPFHSFQNDTIQHKLTEIVLIISRIKIVRLLP